MKTRKKSTTRVVAFPFLALPTEIRYEIYRLLLTVPLLRLQENGTGFPKMIAALSRLPSEASNEAKTQPQSVDGSIECSIQILCLCHQIYDEAFPFFYSHVTIAIEKPFDFANNFLFRLDSTKISQLRSLNFRTAGFKNQDQLADADHSRTRMFKHIVMVFKSYADLKNLHVFVMETVDRVWSVRNVYLKVSEETAIESSSIMTEINPAPYDINPRLWRAGVILANGSLKNFRISWKCKGSLVTSGSSSIGHTNNPAFRGLQQVEFVNSLVFRNNSNS